MQDTQLALIEACLQIKTAQTQQHGLRRAPLMEIDRVERASEVIDLDGPRIDKLLVARKPEAADE